MNAPVDLYDTSYAEYSARVYEEIRKETYGEDLGQTGWMTAAELRGFIELLQIGAGSRVLEVGCGAGGCAVHIARTVGAIVTGIDINEHGIENARLLAKSAGMTAALTFERVDASGTLPFAAESFDAVFSNDAVCHIPGRSGVLKEWHRVLRPGGRILFTDALVITGALSNEEIATRSSIGYYLFLPPGENEKLIASAGLQLLGAHDVTSGVIEISARWRKARERRSEDLIRIEGEENFRGLQAFLGGVHSVSRERRLSRFVYLAEC